jgi:hypothetical protein
MTVVQTFWDVYATHDWANNEPSALFLTVNSRHRPGLLPDHLTGLNERWLYAGWTSAQDFEIPLTTRAHVLETNDSRHQSHRLSTLSVITTVVENTGTTAISLPLIV